MDKSKIGSYRFMFTIILFLNASSLLPAFSIGIIEQDTWIGIMLSLVITLPLICLYCTIMIKFPDKNFIQVLRLVCGKVIGTILAIFYVWFVLTLSALNLGDFANVTRLSLMHQTPMIFIILITVFLAVYAIRNGFSTVTRYSAFFSIISITIVIFSVLLIYEHIDLENFLPMFTFKPLQYIQSAHISATIPTGELIIFLMFTPNVDFDKKKIKKVWIIGFIVGFISVLIPVLRDTAVLGRSLSLFNLPSFVTYRLINIGSIFTRLEILLASVLVLLLSCKVIILCYASVLSICELFGIKDYKNMTFITAIIIAIYSLTLYPNSAVHITDVVETTSIEWTFYEIVIPLIVFIVALIRKNDESNKIPDIYNKKYLYPKDIKYDFEKERKNV